MEKKNDKSGIFIDKQNYMLWIGFFDLWVMSVREEIPKSKCFI